MFTVTFWRQTIERAIKSAAQALLGFWVGAQAFNAWDADWKKAGGVALGGAILSVLTSLASAGVGRSNSPSLVETDDPKHQGTAAKPDLVRS
jgi:hypothetical protein